MKIQFKRLMSFALALVMVLSMVPAIAPHVHAAGTLSTISGLTASWTDASNSKGSASWSASGTGITGTATGYKQILNMAITTKLTLTNNSGGEATLKFAYTLTGGGSVSGAISSTSGNYEQVLADGAAITITLKSPSGANTNTLSITGLSLISTSAADVTTTFKPAAAGGSYTLGGAAVTAETTKTEAAGTEYALAATPASGYIFFGWYDETSGEYVSYDAAYTHTAAADAVIVPEFISSTTALFGVGAARFYNLTEAGAAAAAGSTKTIILLNDGTVSGSHTIPAGTTLLIPFNAGNTLYTTAPAHTNNNLLDTASWVKPTAYRTLTLAADTNITVNGAISVGGKIFAGGGNPTAGGCGVPTEQHGLIKMASGSKITLNSGANLYTWGYITGAGTIDALSGSKVYEAFQIRDFRGGGATTSIANDGIVFPLSQYYVQNIEVPTSYHYGAEEHVYTALYISGSSYTAGVKFIGEGAMFQPASGCVLTKDYVESTDRLNLGVAGDFALANMSLSLAGTEIDSSTFILPITNNITININSGTTTLKQDVALLPGAEVNIAQGATLNLAEGTGSTTISDGTGYNLFVYDLDEWNAGYNIDAFDPDNIEGSEKTTGLHFVHQSYDYIALNYAPGKSGNRAALKDAVINVNGTLVTGGYIYTTENGANIISSEKTGRVLLQSGAGAEAWTYQAAQNDTTPVYYAILVDSAQLKNGDGTYVQTAGAAAGTAYAYCAVHDCWYTGECSLCNVAEYTITFYDDEGNQLDSFTVEEGTTPAYDGTPSKDYTADDCHEYEFKGWATSQGGEVITIPAATADAAYYAVFELVTNGNHDTTVFQYTDNGDGTHKKVLACCGELVNAAEGCSDSDDANHDCDNCDATNIEGHNGGTATCIALAVCDECGESYGAYGDHEYNQTTYTNITATHHTVSYICKHDATHIKSDDPVEHTYVDGVCACKAVKTYTITWDVNGVTTKTTVNHGATPVFSGSTEKADTAEWDYTFSHWVDADGNTGIVAATADATYTAVYTSVKQVYTITWNVEGVETTTSVAYGETPVYDGTPSKAATAEYTYTFTGWSPAVSAVTGDATYTAQFEGTAQSYNVNYYVDGELVHTDTVAYGENIPAYIYTAPVGYTFDGWDNVPATMPAEDVTVNGTITIKSYTITWKDDEGNLIDTTTVEHGTVPTHADAAKEANAQYTYTFAGWYPEVVAATSDAAYSATFRPVLRSYDITFVVEGQEDVVVPTKYGETPVYPNGTPAKATDAYYSYTFAGWDKKLADVSGEATYTATWTETPVEHTITFVIDGETFHVVKGGYGTAADYSELPSTDKTGYTWGGWDKELPATIPAEDIVITGSYTVNQYTITFKGDFNTEKDDAFADYTITKNYGEAITEADIAALEAALSTITGWEFLGWYNAEEVEIEGNKVWKHTSEYEIPETMGAADVTVYAYWEEISYELDVLSSIDGEYIAGAYMHYEEYYEDITSFNSANHFHFGATEDDCLSILPEGYTFAGYEYEDGSDVTFPYTQPAANVNIIAQFKPIDYTVTFMNGETEVGTVTAGYATDITEKVAAITATKEGYVFAGWVDAEGKTVDLTTMPLNGMTVYAKWTVDTFTINFFATEGDATAAATFDVTYGTELTAEYVAELLAQVTDPSKTGYTFSGWNTANLPATMPAEAVNIYGKWDANRYLLTINGLCVNDLVANYEVYVLYGDRFESVEALMKAYAWETALNRTGYTFTGLTDENGTAVTWPLVMPAADVTLNAGYTVNSYTITFDVEGIDPITADYGTAITWPEDPTKEGHTFQGWSTDGENVIDLPATMPVDGLNLKAVWAKNTVYITWNIDGAETTEEYKYGDAITAPEATKASDAKWTYKFTGWDAEIPATATTNATYTAQFEQDEAVKYTVKFVDGEETVHETQIAWNGEVTLDGFTAPAKDHYTLTWTVDGAEVTFPYAMDTKEVTFVANWTPVNYTIYFYASQDAYNQGDVLHSITAAYGTEVEGYTYEAPEGWNFNGWKTAGSLEFSFPYTMGGEDVHLIAQTSRQIFTATFVNGDWSRDFYVGYNNPVSLSVNGKLDTPADHDGYAFVGWFDENGVAYTDEYVMPAHNVTFTAKWTYTGWYTDDNGTTYLVEDEKVYFSAWTEIDGAKYWFDANSYIVKDITLIDGSYYAFDHDTGAFLSDYTGIYTANNGDLYYVENGVAVANKGLVKTVDAEGHIHYYYFGCGMSTCDCAGCTGEYIAQKNNSHWAEIDNGYLVKWAYTTDEDGVIVHDEDTSKNGVHLDDGVKYYYIDGVKVHYGLFIGEDGEYYYARSNGSLVVSRDYWISESHLNGVMRNGAPVEEGSYTFDEEGRIVWPVIVKNGVYAEDGSLYYYADGARTYAGLIKFSGDLVAEDGTIQKNVYADDIIYVRTSGELAVNRSYWATKNNGVMASASYNFDEYGRMIRQNGLVEEDGGLYYYVNGNRYHAGLIKIDGSFYYIKSSGQAVAGCRYWITHTNGYEETDGITEGSYEFAADGKMIIPEPVAVKNGIVEEDGKLYYYVDGKLNYAGLIQYTGSLTTEDGTVIEGAYENAWIYVRTSGELVVGRSYWTTKNNGYMKSATYQFDDSGVMLNPPV